MNKICHVSVLNPSTHNRIFHKLAKSQRSLGYEVSIIGQDARQNPYRLEDIQILPLPVFKRLSSKRFFKLPFWVLSYIRKYPSQIYWLHTPELMWLGYLLKLKGKVVIYDVHEDFFQTITYATHYPVWLRKPLAKGLRYLEKRWAQRLDAVVYAEICYDNMLALPESQVHILRNTFSIQALTPPSEPLSVPDSYLLYTGTLAEEWGIFHTLELWKALFPYSSLPLIMAGFTHSEEMVEKIRRWVEKACLEEYFTFIGGTSYVPYEQIVFLIQHCSFGTALYEINPAIKGKIPTKFYEYMAFDKPLIYTPDPTWEEFDRENHLGVSWIPGSNVNRLWDSLQSWKARHDPSAYSWEEDEKVLRQLLSKISSPTKTG